LAQPLRVTRQNFGQGQPPPVGKQGDNDPGGSHLARVTGEGVASNHRAEAHVPLSLRGDQVWQLL
jgi:hypothetical protein